MIVDLPPTGAVLRPAFGQQGQVKEGLSHFGCRHQQYVVDDTDRTVACMFCDAPLDAFQVLLDYAKAERSYRHWASESLKMRDSLAELRAEERKVKARTAAASRKDANVAVVDERRKSAIRRHEIARTAKEIARLSARILRLSGVRT